MENEYILELRKNSSKAQEFFAQKLAYTLEANELKILMDKTEIKLIDVRDKTDYEVSHLPTAISIPKTELTERISELDKGILSIVYSYSYQCNLALKSAYTLAEYNFPVMILTGGFKSWVEDFRFTTVQ